MNPLEWLRTNANAYMSTPEGVVYHVRRVRTAELVAVGHAELSGKAEVRAAFASVQEAMARGQVDPAGLSEADQAKLEREARHEQEMALKSFFQFIGKTPEREAAYLNRTDSHVCAGVVGLAFLKPGVVVEPFAVVAWDDLADYSPVTIVMDKKSANPDAGILWVGDIHQTVRQCLHGAISKLSGVEALARPFPGSAGVRA